MRITCHKGCSEEEILTLFNLAYICYFRVIILILSALEQGLAISQTVHTVQILDFVSD